MRTVKNPFTSPILVTESFNTQPQPIMLGKVRSLFANPDLPLFVDLGTGKGEFLAKASGLYPQVNWIGIESKSDHLFQALKKKKITHKSNVRYIWMDVEKLKQVFRQGEVDRFYLNFCTPREHPTKRLTHRRFLKVYQDLLSPEGDVIFKTDIPELYEFSLTELEAMKWEIMETSQDLHHSKWNAENITTEWEQYSTSLGCTIHYVRTKPKLNPDPN